MPSSLSFPKAPRQKPSRFPQLPHKAATMVLRGSLSRSLMSTARASAFRSSQPLSAPSRLRSSSLPSSRLNTRRLSFSNPRRLGELGCAQSLMALHNIVAGARLTSHLTVDVRACCELFNGTFRRSCQDR